MCVYVCVRSEDNQFLECLEYEQKTECKPTFSAVIKDVEVVEGSAARFDCKIEGTRAETVDRSLNKSIDPSVKGTSGKREKCLFSILKWFGLILTRVVNVRNYKLRKVLPELSATSPGVAPLPWRWRSNGSLSHMMTADDARQTLP